MLARLLPIALLLCMPLLMGADAIVMSRQPLLVWPPDGWTENTLTPTLRWQSEGHSHLVVTQKGTAEPVVNVLLPQGQDSYTIPSALLAGTTYKWRVRTNPFNPGDSVYTWSVWTREFSFTTSGSVPWQEAAKVQLTAPVNNSLSSSITPTLSWSPPAGATHYEIRLTPAGNESAAVHFVNDVTSSLPIPGPPSWYYMLPDTTYYWRVRVNNAPGPVPSEHPSWGPWSEVWSFRTPVPPSELLGPLSPQHASTITSTTPTLQWSNPNDQVFYYEVQVSKDWNFNTISGQSVAPVYWETRHGGLTNPRNSYDIPSRYPLERGQTYYWRVRPAVQNGQPARWGPTWSFNVAP